MPRCPGARSRSVPCKILSSLCMQAVTAACLGVRVLPTVHRTHGGSHCGARRRVWPCGGAARGRPPHMAHRHGASYNCVPSGPPRHETHADRGHVLRHGHTSSGLSPQAYRRPTKAGELQRCRGDTSGWSGQVISWSVCTSKAQRLAVSPACNLNVVHSGVHLTKRRTPFPGQSGVDPSAMPPRIP